MYATCLFCNKPLGRNESIEAFPVGRRLAFDPAKGRLWVVCEKCERWNLTPLEERWEAIEQADRLYTDTRRRVSTENIGLAKLRDGTTLVRIGEPLRPEYAAWRYGDQFGRRRRRQLLIAGGGIAAIGAVVVGGAVAGAGIGGFGWLISRSAAGVINGNPETVVARIRTEDTGLVHVRRRHLGETTLERASDGSLAINLRFKNGSHRFEGREAERIAAIVIPKVNRFGGSRKTVAAAVREIDQVGSAEGYMQMLSKLSRGFMPETHQAKIRRRSRWGNTSFTRYGLFALPGEHRLALEMALHEEAERRAMEGELAHLEMAWRDAEEIAAISDNLLVPSDVSVAMDRLKSGE